MMRVGWFSPVPPVRSGIAGRSAELVTALRDKGYAIDIYVDSAPGQAQVPGVVSAHDFPWRHRQQPYDLVVYQFGNSSHHDYAWPYAFRYPGLVVLHDTRLHHARAAVLLRERRVADYRSEFAANHPALDADLAELAIAGFDSLLYYDWPMLRRLLAASRLVAVHGAGAADDLRQMVPGMDDRIVAVRLGEGETVTPEREADARQRIRRRYTIPEDAIVFGCFGGLTPEKRIAHVLDALPAVAAVAPSVRLLLAGAPAAHYDVRGDIAARGLSDRVTITGYLDSDAALTDHLAACDVSVNLRWPTARETSGPWLRALAAGRPTIVTDLVHLADVPSLDPRTWKVNYAGMGDGVRGIRRDTGASGSLVTDPASPIPHPRSPIPVCIAIDILDEDHSLRLAMRRLATDASLRARLGAAAREWWGREHSVEAMTDDYVRVMDIARGRRATDPGPPTTATTLLRALAAPFGVTAALSHDGFLE